MKKMGRPKSDNPKCHTLSFRMDEGEYRRLKDYASKHDLTITQLVSLSAKYYMENAHKTEE